MRKRVIEIVLVVVVIALILGLSFMKITGNSLWDNLFETGASEFGVFGGTAVNDLGEVYQCGTINESGSYALNQSINASGVGAFEACLNITADSVVLDGAGFDLFGNNSLNTRGINAQGLINITVKNFKTITEFYIGLYLSSSSNNTLSNITANTNSFGLYLLSSSNNNQLSNITANTNTYGLSLESSSNNQLTDITANSNTFYGLYLLSSSNNNQLSNITANTNINSGIYLLSSSNNNQLSNITANLNNYGVYLKSSNNNNLTNINAESDSVSGIYVEASSNNSLIGLTISSGSMYGFKFDSSSSNIVSNLTITSVDRGIQMVSSDNNQLSIFSINGSILEGVIIAGSSNNTLASAIFTLNGANDTFSQTNSLNNSFVNATYNQSKEYVESGSEIFRKWYLDASSNVADTTISVTGNYSGTGTIPARFELTEYYFDGTDYIYYSNYTVGASKSGYTASASQSVNMSENKAVSFTMTAVLSGDDNGGGGGGGGAVGGPSIYLLTSDQFYSGYSKNLSKDEQMKINISSEWHYVKLVNLSLTQAIINISSTPQQATFNIGDEKMFDVDDDSMNDVLVSLEGITGNKALVFVKKFEEVQVDANDTLRSNDTILGEGLGSDFNAGSFSLIYIVLMVIILVGAGLGAYFFIKKNSQSRKEINKKEIKVVKKEEQKKDVSKEGEEKSVSNFGIWVSGLRKRYRAYRLKAEKQRLIKVEDERKRKEEKEKQKKLEQEKRAKEEKERQKRRELEIKAKEEKEKKLRDEKERQRKAEKEIKCKEEAEQKAKKSPLMSEIIQTIEKSEKAIEKKDIIKAKDLYESAAERYNSISEEDKEVKERLLKVYKKLGF